MLCDYSAASETDLAGRLLDSGVIHCGPYKKNQIDIWDKPTIGFRSALRLTAGNYREETKSSYLRQDESEEEE